MHFSYEFAQPGAVSEVWVALAAVPQLRDDLMPEKLSLVLDVRVVSEDVLDSCCERVPPDAKLLDFASGLCVVHHREEHGLVPLIKLRVERVNLSCEKFFGFGQQRAVNPVIVLGLAGRL